MKERPSNLMEEAEIGKIKAFSPTPNFRIEIYWKDIQK